MNPNTKWSDLLTPAWVFSHLSWILTLAAMWFMTMPKYQWLGMALGGTSIGGNLIGTNQAKKEGVTKGFAEGIGATPPPVDVKP